MDPAKNSQPILIIMSLTIQSLAGPYVSSNSDALTITGGDLVVMGGVSADHLALSNAPFFTGDFYTLANIPAQLLDDADQPTSNLTIEDRLTILNTATLDVQGTASFANGMTVSSGNAVFQDVMVVGNLHVSSGDDDTTSNFAAITIEGPSDRVRLDVEGASFLADTTVRGKLAVTNGGTLSANSVAFETLDTSYIQATNVLSVGPDYVSTTNSTFTLTNQLRQSIYGLVHMGSNDAADVVHGLDLNPDEYSVHATLNYNSDTANLVNVFITEKTRNTFTIKILPVNMNTDTSVAVTLTHFAGSGDFAGGFGA